MGMTTFVGILICIGAIIFGIMDGGKIDNFIDVASILLTVIPTIGALITAFPFSLLMKIPAHIKVLIGKGYQIEDYITQIVNLSKKTRAEGMLALQDEQIDEPFMKFAVGMMVDGLHDENIRNTLEENLESLKKRHFEAISVYERAASFAPAFGMCATVIGLVNMLKGLDFSDPTAINALGSNMAMALITTLYGSMMANVVFLPIAARLKLLHNREVYCKTVIGNGILAIQRGENPLVIQDGLVELLSKKAQKKFMASGGGQADAK